MTAKQKHQDALDALQTLFGKVKAVDAQVAAMRQKIVAAQEADAQEAADAFLSGGATAVAKKTAGKVDTLRAELAAIEQARGIVLAKHAAAIVAEEQARMAWLREDQEQRRQAIPVIQAEIQRLQDEVAAGEKRLANQNAAIAKAQADIDAIEIMGGVDWLRGNLDELAKQAEAPSVAVDRLELSEKIAEWRKGFSATDNHGNRRIVVPTVAYVFFSRNTGRILDTVVKETANIEGGLSRKAGVEARFGFDPYKHSLDLLKGQSAKVQDQAN